MEITAVKNTIESGNAVLGIEFGSTRIKAVLIDENHNPIAQGGHSWENRFENGVWTYHMEDVWAGLQDAYSKLKSDVLEKYGVKLTCFKAMGFSAMMHGYLAFDESDELDVTIFSSLWADYVTEIKENSILLIKGKAEIRNSKPSMIAREIKVIEG